MQNSGQRFVILGIFTVVIFIYLVRLFYIQVIDDNYKLSANNNVLRYITEYPARGLVYDRTGKLLVYNEAVYDLMVIPKQVKDFDTTSFCEIIGISKEEFEKKLKKARTYSRVKSSIFEKQLSAETYAVLQEKLFKFHGFYVQPRTLRKYPNKIAGHTLGYIGEVDDKLVAKNPYYQSGDYIGVSGLEQSYEVELRGQRGVRIVMVDVFNREKGSFSNGEYDSAAVSGQNLVTTLDLELQMLGERLLENKIGSVVAIEPSTGEILAIVTKPGYDPNLLVGRVRSKNYAQLLKDELKPLFNRAMMAYYPPGSTFKLVNALIAQQESIITPSTVFPHSFVVGSKSVKCHPHPGGLSLEGAVQYSCNPYFCNAFRAFVDNRKFVTSENGYKIWRDYVLSFGVGRKIGVDLPHELEGNVPKVDFYDRYYGKGRWKASTIFSLGIGQGELGITPLQMANIMCIIANKGYYYTPHIVKKIGDKTNSTRNLSEKHVTLVDASHFEVIQNGMQKVVEAGTARIARFGNVVICGKTGTAQNPHGKDHSLFVAFAPRENPKIAIAVMVENSGFGATWAAPVASLMMEKYLTDSISRPELYERMIKGNLLPTKKDSLFKKTDKPKVPELESEVDVIVDIKTDQP
ncbi:MAG: penicillin-binding protein 2 [Bacteroidia bacterium]|nr:penicillin-binding protein 2 [Bacteroidota bacterium]MBK7390422.1 penicillin-binding protein 2 [Bacteroidota bacterium]MBK9424564.1 penicillin-binding protein 2 [Bacteroidota bacterium]MBP9081544.1 penicillin-binding protein 2 [Bacteroidia bacterium]